MRHMLIPLLAVLCVATQASAGAQDDLARLYGVDATAQDDDYAPGEGGSWTSDEGSLPPCDSIGQGLDGSCTIGPDTPVDHPAVAPDGCLNQIYYDDWELFWPWACG